MSVKPIPDGYHTVTPIVPMTLRAVTKLVDENTETFTMYGTGKHGKDMKMMEITYTHKP